MSTRVFAGWAAAPATECHLLYTCQEAAAPASAGLNLKRTDNFR